MYDEEYMLFMDEKYMYFPNMCVVNQNMCVNFICVKPFMSFRIFPVASAMNCCTITKKVFSMAKMIIND